MCDTLVAMQSYTSNNSIILGNMQEVKIGLVVKE